VNPATNAEDYNKLKLKPNKNNTGEARIFSPAFETVWQEWEKFRKEKKQTLTESTKAKQLKMLAKYDEQTAIAMLEKSITNGWVGIFPIKQEDLKPKYDNQTTKRDQMLEQFRNRQYTEADQW
jgi:hypothetical protein